MKIDPDTYRQRHPMLQDFIFISLFSVVGVLRPFRCLIGLIAVTQYKYLRNAVSFQFITVMYYFNFRVLPTLALAVTVLTLVSAAAGEMPVIPPPGVRFCMDLIKLSQ